MTAPPFKLNPGFLPPETLERAIGWRVRGRLKGYVYQKTIKMFANAATTGDPFRQKRINSPRPNPQTQSQTVQRNKMARAVSEWLALNQEEKQWFRAESKRKFYTNRWGSRKEFTNGYQYFLSQHINGKI